MSPQVAGEVATATCDDTAASASGALAFTGSTSLPLVVGGIALLLAGGTIVLVARQRERQQRARA